MFKMGEGSSSMGPVIQEVVDSIPPTPPGATEAGTTSQASQVGRATMQVPMATPAVSSQLFMNRSQVSRVCII